MYFPVNIAGGTYRHTDLSLTAQRTINYWPQRQDTGSAKSVYTLESFPGLKSFGTSPVQTSHRGTFRHKNEAFMVVGETLYAVDSGGSYTSCGSIPGSGRVIADSLVDDLVLATDGVAYTWDGTTLTTGTDADFESPYAVTVINEQAVYDGDFGRFGHSDVGQPLDINGLNYGTAESKGGEVIRPFAFNNIVYMMTGSRIEQWWNSGVGNPKFDKIVQGTIEVGLKARYSVATDDVGIYFLADDNQAYYLTGGTPTPLMPGVIVREIASLEAQSDAIGWAMTIDGQWFYVLKFPTGDRTFVYPKGGEWFELSSGVGGGKYQGDGYIFCYNRHLIADESGNLLELDLGTYTENGSTIRRVRTLSPIHSGLMGAPGKEVEIASFTLVGKTGVGTGTGSGEGANPQVILQWSTDGKNWSSEQRGYIGKSGVMMELIFDVNEAAENFIFRIVQTDPTYASWHSAGIEASLGL